MNTSEMSVIEDINKVVEWYAKEYHGAPIELLMDAKTKLLTLCWTFSGEVADARKGSVLATVFRKADHHTMKARLIEEGFTLGLAESKTVEGVKTQLIHEAESEALSFHSKLNLDLAIKVAEDITQRISVLKKEREQP